MSTIAHYYYRQASVNTLPTETKTQMAAPASTGASATGANSFQATLTSSQQVVTETVVKTAPQPAPERPTAPPSTTPTLEQLVKFARSQGWNEKQISLMKRLSLRKNSRTGLSASTLTASAKGQATPRSAIGQVRSDGLSTSATDGENIRGIRNNNPGNIESSESYQWQGQNGNDGRFATFSSPEYGIRALGINLLAYHRRGLDTISKIISRWAPLQDNNDTPGYIQKVSQELGVSPHARLDVASPSVLSALSKAIIHHENGCIPFSEQVISSGIFSALGLQDLPSDKSPYIARAPVLSQPSFFTLQTRHMSEKDVMALRQALAQQMKSAKIMSQFGGKVMNMPNKAELVAAWGYTEGSQRYHELQHVMNNTNPNNKNKT